MTQHSGQILALNLRPALALLASVGETELEDTAFDACLATLPATKATATAEAGDRWHALSLGRLETQLAQAGEGDRIALRVEAPHGYGRAVDALIRTCGTYILQDALGSRAEAEAQHP